MTLGGWREQKDNKIEGEQLERRDPNRFIQKRLFDKYKLEITAPTVLLDV